MKPASGLKKEINVESLGTLTVTPEWKTPGDYKVIIVCFQSRLLA